MIKCTFNNVDELKKFIDEIEYYEVKYCVGPDYIDAIIGISDEGKVVYDYFKMVTHLARIYEEEGNSEDPEMDAIEWIDYNCDIPYWEIVTTDTDYWYEELGSDKLEDYKKYFIGPNMHGVLLIDSEKITDQNIDDLENVLKGLEVEFKIT